MSTNCKKCGGLLHQAGARLRCRVCINASRRKRRADPESRRRELDRDNMYRKTEAHREQHRLYEQARRDADREGFKAYRRDYYARTRKSSRVLLTPEEKRIRARAALRAHWRANRQEYRTRTNNYLARKRGAEGAHTADDIDALLKNQGFKCFWCSADIADGKHHVDHLIPLIKGGSNWPENLVGACSPCNRSKGAKMPEEFLAFRASCSNSSKMGGSN
jgi:5-methylcytosine-specific restriction endonuclease McrA